MKFTCTQLANCSVLFGHKPHKTMLHECLNDFIFQLWQIYSLKTSNYAIMLLKDVLF